MTPSDKRKSGARGKPATGPACPSCAAAVVPGARFCQACGVSLAGGPGGGKRWGFRLATAGAAGGLFAVTVFATMKLSEPDSAPPPPSAVSAPVFDAPPVASSGGPPDLSRMTPRQAADRLFSRIMIASEKGNRAEALRFVPMAIQAYGSLPAIDRDAHYHLGLIHGVAGDRAGVVREIAILRQGAPDHLLALVLEHDDAERSGDRATVARVLAAFPAAYAAEASTGRPEYDGHRNVIERLRASAAQYPPFPAPRVGSTPSAAKPSVAVQEGAALFAAKCAACHGRGGVGSDTGPPLVHKIYEPGHHNDASFYRAVSQGARAHHWKFGDMAPVPGVSGDEVGRIIAYVRDLQRAAGIR